ncbi:LysR family transcriptional regulator [Kibdelosporangium phytohabitans]|uniref:LysR family transcriptional regulator n=1 Tax=Kibdelosporangium phytohabitans TaxID=860235 RepID=A0A0N9I574_9PSEU|nr:LysR family transcriptional regulator [Kibdelosporangium phytohabitans]ALG11043.1 LysR family transcriptional regulator [Kibdelosporangium phytohabitans]MBE1462272.1 DNA-binding transcriptional LysR family regulator [Kibdelosporangium phytohabitans]
MKPLSPDFMDDLRRLRVLREFRERGSITATARALHLTPSAVSQQLTGLSRHLGFPVTQPDGRRVVLTPRARTLLAHADAVFAHIERARHDLDSWDEITHGTVTIGAFPTAITGLVPRLLTQARSTAPTLGIRVTEAEPPDLFDLLDAGKLTIGLAVSFVGSPATNDPRYHQVDLGADELDVLLPHDHSLTASDRVDLTALAQEQWIAGDGSGCCGAITATACAAAGFAPDIVHRTNDWQAVAQLVAHGHGVALMPRLAQRSLPDSVTVRPTGDPVPLRRIFAAIPEGAQTSPIIKLVLALLSSH